MSIPSGEGSPIIDKFGLTTEERALIDCPPTNLTSDLDPNAVKLRIAAAKLIATTSDIATPTEVNEHSEAFASLLRSQGIDLGEDVGERPIGILVNYGTFARDAWRRAREVAIQNQTNTGSNEMRYAVSRAANALRISESNRPSYKGKD